MRTILLLTAILSPYTLAVTEAQLDEEIAKQVAERQPDYREENPEPEVWYFEPQDVYDDIVDWERENNSKLHMNLKICVNDDCEIFFHYEQDNYNYSTIRLSAGPDAKNNKRRGVSVKGGVVKEIGLAIAKGVSAGGRIKLKYRTETKPDGTKVEVLELDAFGGVGVGTDAPVPGEEDGKQVHHK